VYKFALPFSLQRNAKVAVCGASGGIGQPLALLLKGSPHVTELSLYDIVHTPGVAADLSHIETAAKVKGFNGPEQLKVGMLVIATRITGVNTIAKEALE
jgi:malate dehydrogenase